MTERQAALLEAAKAHHGDIRPVRGGDWHECYTEDRGKLMLWFDKDIGQERPTTGVFIEGSNHGRAA
jgi:hypothetical protein